jgi:hypothetical protein
MFNRKAFCALVLTIISILYSPAVSATEVHNAFVQKNWPVKSKLPPSLDPGCIFDPRIVENELKITSTKSSSDWYRVPKWLAGVWQAKSAELVSQRNLKTGITEQENYHYSINETAQYGVIVDKLGQIWQPLYSQTWTENEYKEQPYSRRTLYLTNKFLKSDEEKISFETLSLNFNVDKANKKILRRWFAATHRMLVRNSSNTFERRDIALNFEDDNTKYGIESTNAAKLSKIDDFIQSQHISPELKQSFEHFASKRKLQ